jgi:guanidinoacetate N-methyltransferase
VTIDGGLLRVGDFRVMSESERPIMRRFAEIVADADRDVLEMGFGLGICAGEIQARGCKSHTIIEAHPVIAESAREWAASQLHPVTIVEGYWQNVLASLGQFDSVLWEGFVASEGDGVEQFAEAVMPHIRAGGVFTTWNEGEPSERLRNLLVPAFRQLSLVRFDIPNDCSTIAASAMLIIPVAKGKI